MYVCSLYGFQFLVHIISCLIIVQYDGDAADDAADAKGKRSNQYKTKGGKIKWIHCALL